MATVKIVSPPPTQPPYRVVLDLSLSEAARIASLAWILEDHHEVAIDDDSLIWKLNDAGVFADPDTTHRVVMATVGNIRNTIRILDAA